MNSEIWQQLLPLESRDITTKWFQEIHALELNARRAKEINSAAKQSREYFRNAADSDYSVRPLLTFYGVASLSRSLLLLLKRNQGEESLTGSHGLETINWGTVMSGEVAVGLRNLGDLKVRTTKGLFTDFANQTDNRISVHVNSSRVDWHVCYDSPKLGVEVSVMDLFSRIPDLRREFESISSLIRYATVNEMTYSEEKGFRAKVRKSGFDNFQDYYATAGYDLSENGDWIVLSTSSEVFSKNLPLFIHSYLIKTFGSIPSLHISEPFKQGALYSQLCVVYMVSYVLGMLVRYYPTHWMSLAVGDKGDQWWPVINRAQQMVEESFPELIIELIDDVIRESKEERKDAEENNQASEVTGTRSAGPITSS